MGDRAGVPERVNDGWLASAEARALRWLAARLPDRVTPDQLTGLGFLGAVVCLVGYLLAGDHPAALWLVNLGLVANWLGDSLDGHVARKRGIERPRYGFFLDQSVDILAQFLFAAGLTGSGLMHPAIVAFGLATYLMMTALSLLRAQTTGVFALATQGVGLTEVRCLFLLGNALFFFFPPRPFPLAGLTVTYADLFGLLWIAINLALYLASMVAQLRALGRIEPPAGQPAASPPRRDTPSSRAD